MLAISPVLSDDVWYCPNTALAAVHLVLGLSGNKLVASQDAQIEIIRNVESGDLGLAAFSEWLMENSVLRPPKR